MKKFNLIALSILALVACNKNSNDGTSTNKSTTTTPPKSTHIQMEQLLTDRPWNKIGNTSYVHGPIPGQWNESTLECEKDDTYMFHPNRTIEFENGVKECFKDEPKMKRIVGTWQLVEDGKRFRMFSPERNIESKILELSDTIFKMHYTIRTTDTPTIFIDDDGKEFKMHVYAEVISTYGRSKK